MSATPDIQYFASSGTWHKPPGAIRVDVMVQAAGGGGTFMFQGTGHGSDGEITARSYRASSLADEVHVEVGIGGKGAAFGAGFSGGDGADGYALIVTHVAADGKDGEQ